MLNSKVLTLSGFSCAALILLPLQALAQDADWSGAFVGAKVGLGAIESEIHDFDEEAAFGYSKNDGAAATVDLQAGYNWQSGNFVYGAVLSIGATNFDESFDTDFCSPTTHATTVNALASLRGRAGFAAGNTLFYGTAGIASIDTEESLACDDDISFEVDDRYEALVVGFGVESMMTDNLSISAEYLSYIADNQEIEGFEDGEAEDEFSTFDIKADTVSIGVNYHFF
jgi:outer membrane immunogenic protein